MTTQHTIQNTVTKAISDVIRMHDEITAETTLKDDIGMDSLHRWELSVKLERIYKIQINCEEMEHVRTVGELVGLVESKLSTGLTVAI